MSNTGEVIAFQNEQERGGRVNLYKEWRGRISDNFRKNVFWKEVESVRKRKDEIREYIKNRIWEVVKSKEGGGMKRIFQ